MSRKARFSTSVEVGSNMTQICRVGKAWLGSLSLDNATSRADLGRGVPPFGCLVSLAFGTQARIRAGAD